MNPPPRPSAACAAAVLLLGCAPALDWRELRIADSGVKALLPCRPDRQARQLTLAGQPVRLVLYACKAGGATWAVATADMVDPALVGPALLELRTAAARNLGAVQAPRPLTLQVAGATPHPHSARLEIHGQLPDGLVVTEQLAVFSKGTRVFQATAIGATLAADGTESFFAGLRAAP